MIRFGGRQKDILDSRDGCFKQDGSPDEGPHYILFFRGMTFWCFFKVSLVECLAAG